MAVNPLVIANAGLPGAADSYYSAEKTLSAIGSAKTLIPEVGWILFEAGQDADLTIQIKITATPTYAALSAASAGACVWSDGTNIFVGNAGTTTNAKYFVVAHKP
jgi:hypothetical protein